LEAVKLEQAKAHVPVRQAKPLFLDKLKQINEFVISPVKDRSLCPFENLKVYVSEVKEMDYNYVVVFSH
jgi:hypothetical protein